MWGWSSLRLLHVLAGVFWTGNAFFMASYLLPSLRRLQSRLQTGAIVGALLLVLSLAGMALGHPV